MKRYVYASLMCFVLLAQNSAFAQSDEKIRGSRNVIVKQTYVDNFNTLILNGELSVNVVFNSKPSIEIEADDNLHEVIIIDVTDGILTLSQSKRITSKKRLEITVNYSEPLEKMNISNEGEVRSLTTMELGDFSLTTADNTKAYLNINAKAFTFKSSGRSKTRLNLTADSSAIELLDDSKLEGLVNSKSVLLDMYQKADAVLEGRATTSTLRLSSSTDLDARNFNIDSCSLQIEDNADISLSVAGSLTMKAAGKSDIYLYGSPNITIEEFTGSSKLQKKEG